MLVEHPPEVDLSVDGLWRRPDSRLGPVRKNNMDVVELLFPGQSARPRRHRVERGSRNQGLVV